MKKGNLIKVILRNSLIVMASYMILVPNVQVQAINYRFRASIIGFIF